MMKCFFYDMFLLLLVLLSCKHNNKSSNYEEKLLVNRNEEKKYFPLIYCFYKIENSTAIYQEKFPLNTILELYKDSICLISGEKVLYAGKFSQDNERNRQYYLLRDYKRVGFGFKTNMDTLIFNENIYEGPDIYFKLCR